jgi:hypothetical protein
MKRRKFDAEARVSAAIFTGHVVIFAIGVALRTLTSVLVVGYRCLLSEEAGPLHGGTDPQG